MISTMQVIKIRRTTSRLLVSFLFTLGSGGTVFAADMVRGGNLYAAHCSACHGASGVSRMPGTPNFARNTGLMQPDMSLLTTIKSGKNVMPAFQGILSDRDILDVIVYIRTLN